MRWEENWFFLLLCVVVETLVKVAAFVKKTFNIFNGILRLLRSFRVIIGWNSTKCHFCRMAHNSQIKYALLRTSTRSGKCTCSAAVWLTLRNTPRTSFSSLDESRMCNLKFFCWCWTCKIIYSHSQFNILQLILKIDHAKQWMRRSNAKIIWKH